MGDSVFAHVGLTCKNPRALEQFYTKYFGFRRVKVLSLGTEEIVFSRSGNFTLEFFQAKEERPVPAAEKDGPAYPGWKHLAFEVPNVAAKLAEMGKDARITLGPFKFDDFIPGWETVWVADPEGNIIEITQGYKEDPNTPPLA